MFKKKYIPSIKNNNLLRDKVSGELMSLIYRLEHGKYDSEADGEAISRIVEELKIGAEALSHSVGTGEENVEPLATKILELIKELKKQTDQNMLHRIEESASDLDFYVGLWKDALDGTTAIPSEEETNAAKVSFSRRKLNAKLGELAEIKESFVENARRLEKDISGFEKDMKEIDDAILNEDNERKINELYKSISAINVKVDSLTVRKNNYTTCFNLLDMIYVNASEIVTASDFAGEEISKAKVLLNISKLRRVLSEPDKAMRILKRMQVDIQEVCERTKKMDEKISSVSGDNTFISQDAMAYKEELMRKKREKAANAEKIGEPVNSHSDNKSEITEEK